MYLHPAATSCPEPPAPHRIDQDRVPPQTAAMMEGAAQLLTDGFAGSPLLGEERKKGEEEGAQGEGGGRRRWRLQ